MVKACRKLSWQILEKAVVDLRVGGKRTRKAHQVYLTTDGGGEWRKLSRQQLQ